MTIPTVPVRVTIGLIVLQLAVLLWTVTSSSGASFSMFCAVGDDALGDAFSTLHFAFLLLLPIGLASLRFPWLRLVYAVVLLASLATLTQQRNLIAAGHLHCDTP